MADERENIIEEREKKLNDERQKIETFSDFGNIYNFKNDFTYSYKTDAGNCP
jgi:Fe-S cluster assembly protein SufB